MSGINKPKVGIHTCQDLMELVLKGFYLSVWGPGFQASHSVEVDIQGALSYNLVEYKCVHGVSSLIYGFPADLQ